MKNTLFSLLFMTLLQMPLNAMQGGGKGSSSGLSNGSLAGITLIVFALYTAAGRVSSILEEAFEEALEATLESALEEAGDRGEPLARLPLNFDPHNNMGGAGYPEDGAAGAPASDEPAEDESVDGDELHFKNYALSLEPFLDAVRQAGEHMHVLNDIQRRAIALNGNAVQQLEALGDQLGRAHGLEASVPRAGVGAVDAPYVYRDLRPAANELLEELNALPDFDFSQVEELGWRVRELPSHLRSDNEGPLSAYRGREAAEVGRETLEGAREAVRQAIEAAENLAAHQ